MGDLDHHDDKTVVFDFANDTVGANTIAPIADHVFLQPLTDQAGVSKCKDAFFEVKSDTALDGWIELVQRTVS